MKNKLIIAILVLGSNVLLAQEDAEYGPDCATPTQYVMQFLKKSTTLWHDSDDWKDKIRENGATIETKYAEERQRNVKCRFKISNQSQSDCVEVDSTIEDHEIREANSDEEITEFKNMIEQYNEDKKTQADFCSQCEFTLRLKFDEKTRKLHTILVSSCKSKIPYLLFMKKINESKN